MRCGARGPFRVRGWRWGVRVGAGDAGAAGAGALPRAGVRHAAQVRAACSFSRGGACCGHKGGARWTSPGVARGSAALGSVRIRCGAVGAAGGALLRFARAAVFRAEGRVAGTKVLRGRPRPAWQGVALLVAASASDSYSSRRLWARPGPVERERERRAAHVRVACNDSRTGTCPPRIDTRRNPPQRSRPAPGPRAGTAKVGVWDAPFRTSRLNSDTDRSWFGRL